MCTKKHVLIFLAGAEAFHSLAHLLLAFANVLPLRIFGITLTPQLNIAAITLNAIIAVGLLWWASKVKK